MILREAIGVAYRRRAIEDVTVGASLNGPIANMHTSRNRQPGTATAARTLPAD
jgi:hypothetical protein